MKIISIAIALFTAANASNAETRDIVEEAASAIIARDADALESMRFQASSLNGKLLSVGELLGRTSQCQLLDRDMQLHPQEIRFMCDAVQDEQSPCDSNIMTVSLSRATSPDIFAHLGFKRLETKLCALPLTPGPM